MEQRTFDTPYGPIVLVGRGEAFEGRGPLVVAIAGAFAIPRGPLFQLEPVLESAAEVVTGHLPGNHCPTLIGAAVGVYASAYSHVIANAFAGRRVAACGASIGGLVTLGLRAPEIKRALVIEPPLVMSKVWPMRPTLRAQLAGGDPDVAKFVTNVFGVLPKGVQERRYDYLLRDLRVPTHVLLGDEPLFPERPFEKLPSLVDTPERELMAAHPLMRVTVAPAAGHNVLQQSVPAFVAALRELVADAVAA